MKPVRRNNDEPFVAVASIRAATHLDTEFGFLLASDDGFTLAKTE